MASERCLSAVFDNFSVADCPVYYASVSEQQVEIVVYEPLKASFGRGRCLHHFSMILLRSPIRIGGGVWLS